MQHTRLGPYTVFFDSSEEYHRLKREVWGANGYYVELEKANPVILDIGAHIGLTTLYYKKLYPQSKIIAVEPVPENAALLRHTIFENQLEGVEVYEEAVSDHAGEETLYAPESGEWRSNTSVYRGAWTGDQESIAFTVACRLLSYYLDRYRPDLVKLDIEGAEQEVLTASKASLTQSPRYLIEFHPVDGRGMDGVIKLFGDLGYEVTVEKDGRQVHWRKAWGLSLIRASR